MFPRSFGCERAAKTPTTTRGVSGLSRMHVLSATRTDSCESRCRRWVGRGKVPVDAHGSEPQEAEYVEVVEALANAADDDGNNVCKNKDHC